MAKTVTRVRDLIILHLKEELTANEYQELQDWIHSSQDNAALFSQLTDPAALEEALKESYDLGISIRRKIDERLVAAGLYPVDSPGATAWPAEAKLIPLPETDTRPTRRIWLSAAGACLLALSTGSYFWYTRLPQAAVATHALSKNDVAPGGDKAILTLGNDSTIVLENAANGSLVLQGATRVSKDKNLLAYTAAAPGNNQSAYSASTNNGSTNPSSGNSLSTNTSAQTSPLAMVYNTLTTPRAGQFQLILPDGSKVWLNNASSLRYPTAFTGKDREVTLSGEAYFEIAKDAARPFVVQVNGVFINVLGTSFNVMAYGDDRVIKTTLLTGKVSLSLSSSGKQTLPSSDKQMLLEPGEQAMIGRNERSNESWKITKVADAEEAIAWQRGYFHFAQDNIGDVLRQLARWYDVEVAFTIAVPDYKYDGEIGRELSLSSILRHLEKKDLHFQIDGKKLIVSK